MVDREYRNDLLEASYEAVRLELENTEKDVEQLRQRADKLRAAVEALGGILPDDDGSGGSSGGKNKSSEGSKSKESKGERMEKDYGARALTPAEPSAQAAQADAVRASA